MYDPRWDGAREREDGRPRVYDERERSDHDPRGGLMRDLDLPRGEERQLVVDRDRVYELNGEDSRTLAAVGAFRVVAEHDLDSDHDTLDHLRDEGLVDTVDLGDDESRPEMKVWWATPLECQSALQHRHRENPLPADQLSAAIERLRQLVQHADTIAPTDELRRRAGRLLSFHPLRAADALQLAAALVWCEEQPHGEAFVTVDERLREAALKEGFIQRP